ncbi:hypothetical protein A5647_21055 [Mycobacterium sp. 1100029.7]|nr:hypothetical protein A5647_21055 [Mycobacterium sp. 1100029.7]
MFAVLSDNIRASDDDRNNTCEALDTALGDGQLSTEEHRERVSAATKATTLGELQSLVADLQVYPAPAAPPQARNRIVWIAVAAAVTLVLLGGGVAWTFQRGTSTPAASRPTVAPSTGNSTGSAAAVTSAPPAPLLTFSGVSGVLAQMRTQFGDTLGYQLNVYQDQAVVMRPDTANAHKTVAWLYRDGNWTDLGPKPSASSGAAVGDLSKFDAQAVLGVVQQAPQTLHIYDANRMFLTVESRKDGSLSLHVHASDGALSGTITIGADGSVMQISPPAR